MLESYKELIAAKSEIRQLRKRLKEMKPVKRAHWESTIHMSEEGYIEDIYKCDNCGRMVENLENYCPSCGAQMDEVTK